MLRSADRSCRSHDRVREEEGNCLSVCLSAAQKGKKAADRQTRVFFGVNELEEGLCLRVYCFTLQRQ